jgi:hypothetical protein
MDEVGEEGRQKTGCCGEVSEEAVLNVAVLAQAKEATQPTPGQEAAASPTREQVGPVREQVELARVRAQLTRERVARVVQKRSMLVLCETSVMQEGVEAGDVKLVEVEAVLWEARDSLVQQASLFLPF